MLMAPRSAAAPQARVARSAPDEAPRRIGILGGTFDPPHIGHLWLAALAADALDLDCVLFMPAAQPPHKGGRIISRAADRLLMARLAINANPSFELTGLEMERPGPSYTIDSVIELKRLHPDTELFLVMATDSLDQIDTWREPDRLLQEIEWAVGPRPGSELPDRSRLEERFGERASRIHLLDGPSLDVSSSQIRRRVAAGRTIRYLVPRDVEEMIIERRLYRRG
ncbi:MAG: nicotinate-nucleotide adenylyltransferase [Candidatus Limnocylindria bacterium]